MESQATDTGCAPRRRPAAAALELVARAAAAVFCVAASASFAAGASGAASAEIELHKSFGAGPRPNGSPDAAASPGPAPASTAGGAQAQAPPLPDPPLPPPPPDRRPLGLAAAIGETLVATGTLHLPEVGGAGLSLEVARTPFVEFATGQRAILDAGGVIPPATAAEISRRWPGFVVVKAPADQGLRGLLDGLLAASGYASVLRRSSVTFGREATVVLRPDFVILKRDDDLLTGETRTLTVLDSPAEALPAELRELARQHGINVAEIAADGAVLGGGPPPWRDPAGKVTIVEARSAALVLGELAESLGLAIARQALPRADASKAGLAAAVRELIERSGLPAIGPTVLLTPPTAAGAAPRFTVSVPGWLVTTADARRVLVTGAAPPELLRLFLARDGIHIFEYRLAGR